MKLTLEGIRDRAAWEAAGIALPSYDVEAARQASVAAPRWAHVGIGNIFRIFIGGIAEQLIAQGEPDVGITCVEAFDFDVVEKIYRPYDNLVLGVTLHADGRVDKSVRGSLAQVIEANATEAGEWERLQKVFRAPSLQMVSFTITEKGYALRGIDGSYLPFVAADIEAGPERPTGAMAIVASMLLERYRAGAAPLALVSMDNCSHNGEHLREAVLEMVHAWAERGYVDQGFVDYVSDEGRVAFPWTMIDKITPRPSEDVAAALAADGVEGMDVVVTSKQTYIAPFVNAEGPQYLVVEDSFPNGRPALERGGVLLCDRETVDKSEKMKVTVCLNPIHTALCTYDCMLGYDLFADGMADPQLRALAELIGKVEGMAVVPNPGILSPEAFLDECLDERFPNPYLGDTSLRIATDISQMVGIRFGITVRSHMERGDSAELLGIPLAIAGWLRYLLALDDEGKPMELAPEPMLDELQAALAGIELGKPESVGDKLRPILSNERIFYVDLYEAGLGQKIERLLAEELAGPGAVRATLVRYLG
jgi:fructuronate reductase